MLCSTIKAGNKSLTCNKPSVNSIAPPGPDLLFPRPPPTAAPPCCALAWGKDPCGGDHQQLPAQPSISLEREVTLSGGFGLSKHLCTHQMKPTAAQDIHLISRHIQPTAYNQESLQDAKLRLSRESLAWQCPQTSYGWAEFKKDCKFLPWAHWGDP